MGSCASTASQRAERRVDATLTAALRRAADDAIGVSSILLLGTGNSGKSTVMKQVNLLHSAGFSASYRQETMDTIRHNILVSVHVCCQGVRDTGLDVRLAPFLEPLPPTPSPRKIDSARDQRTAAARVAVQQWSATQNTIHPRNYGCVEALVTLIDRPPSTLHQAVAVYQYCPEKGLPTSQTLRVCDVVAQLWHDPAIQYLYKRHRIAVSSRLEANIDYFMDKLECLAAEGYCPTDEDCLQTRKRTTGAHTMAFKMGNAPFVLTDVGGQQSERKRWVSHFDNVSAILFLVGLDGYAQVLLEDGQTNRLQDAIQVFREMVLCPFFTKTHFLLFLNKVSSKNKLWRGDAGMCGQVFFFFFYTGGLLPIFHHHRWTYLKPFSRDPMLGGSPFVFLSTRGVETSTLPKTTLKKRLKRHTTLRSSWRVVESMRTSTPTGVPSSTSSSPAPPTPSRWILFWNRLGSSSSKRLWGGRGCSTRNTRLGEEGAALSTV